MSAPWQPRREDLLSPIGPDIPSMVDDMRRWAALTDGRAVVYRGPLSGFVRGVALVRAEAMPQ